MHHVLNSHLEPVNHEKVLQPLLWLPSTNYTECEIQSRPPDMQQCYQQNTFCFYSPWFSLSDKWRGFSCWLLPLQKFIQDLREWNRRNRTEVRLGQSERRQEDPAEEMAYIHRGRYEFKNLKQQLTEIHSKTGMQQISVVKKSVGNWWRSEMGKKERETQPTEVTTEISTVSNWSLHWQAGKWNL